MVLRDPLSTQTDRAALTVGTNRWPTAAAWRRAGFRSRRFDPVFVYDPERLIEPSLPLGVGLIDNDFCFLTDPERPYLT